MSRYRSAGPSGFDLAMFLCQRDLWSWAGIWVVGLTAAAWSFSALADLATLVGITANAVIPGLGVVIRIAWGLPLTVDVLAVVATRVWLRGIAPADAVRYSRRAAWAAIGASILGNAYHGLLSGHGRVDAVIVSAVPAVVIGALVHLAVLVGRPVEDSDDAKPQEDATDPSPVGVSESPVGVVGSPPPTPTGPTSTPLDIPHAAGVGEDDASARPGLHLAPPPPGDDRAAELIADGAGRRRLARELDITENAARRLLDQAKAQA